MSKLLEIKDLCGGYQKDVKVLRHISMDVEQGEAVGILGLNGSGKSTLGKAVMNLLPYRSGSIIFNGKEVSMADTNELVQMGIALMHQGGRVFTNLSVWQNLQLAWGPNIDNDYYNQLVGIIPLLQRSKKELMRKMADKLSGGQRHELALAMTLAQKPKLVILDEPSAGLSPMAVEEMYRMLLEISKRFGIGILLIEQNIMRAVDFCERCVLLGLGKVSYEFTNYQVNVSEIESIMFKK